MDIDQTYYFVATCIASIFGFGFAWTLNRFVNRMDRKMDQFDKMFEGQQEEISELKKITSVQGTRLDHLEDEVYPTRHQKKQK